MLKRERPTFDQFLKETIEQSYELEDGTKWEYPCPKCYGSGEYYFPSWDKNVGCEICHSMGYLLENEFKDYYWKMIKGVDDFNDSVDRFDKILSKITLTDRLFLKAHKEWL